MKLVSFLLLCSIMPLSFNESGGNFKYVDSKGKEFYSIVRTKLNKSEFVDTESIPFDNGLSTGVRVSTDTFCVKKENWYIKQFGKYRLFLGPESFKKDSLIVELDLAVKRSDLGFWSDSQTVYPFSYIYKPERKIYVGNDRAVYVYNSVYYVFKQEADFSSPETVFFDPEIGIVKTFSLTAGEVVLQNYPYLDKLKIK